MRSHLSSMILRYVREPRLTGRVIVALALLGTSFFADSRAGGTIDPTSIPLAAHEAPPAAVRAPLTLAASGAAPAPVPTAEPKPQQASFAHALTITNASAGREDYLAAIAARDAGQHAVAAARFTMAGAGGGLIAPVARLRAAQSLVTMQQREGAASAFAAVLADDTLPSTLRTPALTDAAANLRALNRHAEAIALLSLLDAPDAAANTRASAR